MVAQKQVRTQRSNFCYLICIGLDREQSQKSGVFLSKKTYSCVRNMFWDTVWYKWHAAGKYYLRNSRPDMELYKMIRNYLTILVPNWTIFKSIVLREFLLWCDPI